MSIEDFKAGSRVRVTVEGTVKKEVSGTTVISDSGQFQLWDNVLKHATIEEVIVPIEDGDFIVSKNTDKPRFVGIATSVGYITVIDKTGYGRDPGTPAKMNRDRLNAVYKTITAAEAGKLIASISKGYDDSEW